MQIRRVSAGQSANANISNVILKKSQAPGETGERIANGRAHVT